jgi:hypothetical protein
MANAEPQGLLYQGQTPTPTTSPVCLLSITRRDDGWLCLRSQIEKLSRIAFEEPKFGQPRIRPWSEFLRITLNLIFSLLKGCSLGSDFQNPSD